SRPKVTCRAYTARVSSGPKILPETTMLTKYMPTTPTMMKGMLKTAAHAIGRAAGKLLFTVGLPFGLLSTAYAEVTLPRIFGDGMVLQRDQTVKVWGWATTESAVEVRLGKLQPVSAPVK